MVVPGEWQIPACGNLSRMSEREHDEREAGEDEEIERVTTLEIFFDLVFVFAVTQLASLVAHPGGLRDYGKAILVFASLYWMYSAYTWLTSNLPIRTTAQKQLMFVAMGGFFVMAISIPDVFGTRGIPFALGLLVVTAIHFYMFTTAPGDASRFIWKVARYNFGSAAFVLAAGFVNAPWDWPFWIAATAILVAATLRQEEAGIEVSPSHFVERNGLLMIVALGESIVAVGLSTRDLELNVSRLALAIAALLLTTGLWGTYFDGDEERAEEVMHRSPSERQSRMALLGFGHAHMVMIIGVIIAAAGLEVGIEHPVSDTDYVGVWNVSVGLAVYLLGDSAYRHILRIGTYWSRFVGAAACLALVPVAYLTNALVQAVLAVIIVQWVWMMDRREKRAPHQLV